MSNLKFFNGNLLYNNNLLTTCCCSTTGIYYELLPCNLFERIRTDGACAEWDQCSFKARQFVETDQKCTGPEIKVCECHLLELGNFVDNIRTGAVANGIQVFNQAGNDLLVDWSETGLTLTVVGGDTFTYSFTETTTLAQIFAAVNAWNFLIQFFYGVSDQFTHFIIAPFSATVANNDIYTSSTRLSGLYFRFNGTTDTEGALAVNSYTLFATNINDRLVNFISADMTAIYNAEASFSENLAMYEIKFGGELCGLNYPNFGVYNCLIDIGLAPVSLEHIRPEYFGTDYYLKSGKWAGGHQHFKSNTNQLCDYEDISNPSYPAYSNVHSGPTAPRADNELSCCPQGGAVFGPRQYVDYGIFETSGYGFNYLGKAWWNLEHTIYNQQCLVTPPDFFVETKSGRADFVYSYNKPFHVSPDCNYPDGCEEKNDNLPDNCTPELFIAQLHKDVPWGVFGSYYAGIEYDTHPAWLFPYNDPDFSPLGDQSYLSSTFICARYGWDYRPTGAMVTIGTWRETQKVEIKVDVKRPVPFHVGPETFDDLNLRCNLLPESIIDNAITVVSSGFCDPLHITYNTSGKTIGDFLTAMNALRLQGPSGVPSGVQLFAFCEAGPSVLNIAASKIINTSSELYEQQVNGNNLSVYIGGTGPEADINKDKISGQTFPSSPLSYPDMHKGSIFNIFNTHIPPGKTMGIPTGINGDQGAGIPDTLSFHYECGIPVSPSIIKAPPICRWYSKYLPLESSVKTSLTDFLYNPTMWWTPIQGREEDIILVQKSGIGDPFATNLTISVVSGSSVSGQIIVRSYSGADVFSSGIINLTGYVTYSASNCINDLHNIRLQYITGVTTYQPLLCTLNNNLIQEPLFIHKSVSNGSLFGYGYPTGDLTATTYNYGYEEPPSDLSESSILDNSANIKAWMRKRCGLIESTGLVPVSPFCVPPELITIDRDVNCDGDGFVQQGWLYSYGCGSPRCRSQFFVKGQRCGCDKVYRCNGTEGKRVSHPYNFEGGTADNGELHNGYVVSQPTIYVCEYNFHPFCDFPLMVKVPFQVNDGSRNVLWHNGEFGTFLNDEEVSSSVVPELTNLSCQFCSSDFNICTRGELLASNIRGWCQFLDPRGPKVEYHEIPNAFPSKAIISFRSGKPFCSFNAWNFLPEYIHQGNIELLGIDFGCKPDLGPDCENFTSTEGVNCVDCPNNPACPSCLNFDRIANCKPLYDTGLGKIGLTVLFRPIVTTSQNEVCGGGDTCENWEVSCKTSCCECVYACIDGVCPELKSHPFRQTITYHDSVNTDDIPGQCFPDLTGNPICGHVVIGCCDLNCTISPCIQGYCFNSRVANLVATRTSCNCIVEGCTVYDSGCDVTCEGAPANPTCWSGWSPSPQEPPRPPDCNYVCDNIPTSLGVLGVSCMPNTLIQLQRFQSGCTFYCDLYEESCVEEEFGDCDEYHGTLYKRTENVCEGDGYPTISPPTPDPLGLYSSCQWFGTTVTTINTSLDIYPKIWEICEFLTLNPVSYQYIRNRRYEMGWQPGYANLALPTGNLPDDPRFYGGVC